MPKLGTDKSKIDEVREENLIRRGKKPAPVKEKRPYNPKIEHYFRIKPAPDSGILYVLEHVTTENGRIANREETTPNDIGITLDKAERAMISFRDEK